MPHQCSIPMCNGNYTAEDKVRVFGLPRNEEKRQAWIRVMPVKKFAYSVKAKVCERHFTPDDIESETSAFDEKTGRIISAPLSVTRLKSGAIPSIFPKRTPQKKAPWTKLKVHKTKKKRKVKKHQQQIKEPSPTNKLLDVPTCSSNTDVPSSLPAISNWPGEFEFNVSFSPQKKKNKDSSWTYSKLKDKLYVGKAVSCPINFYVNTVLPDDAIIRAIALYSSSDTIAEDDLDKGIEAEHLIECENSLALYEVDPATHLFSVVVPFKNPPAGQTFTTIIYKFASFESCSSYPNARPFIVVFTLERKNEVIGQRKLYVKICECPVRDRKFEETQKVDEIRPVPLKRNEPSEFVKLSNAMEFTQSVAFPPVKKDILPNKDGKYVVHVDTLECYKFLKQMMKFYENCKAMNNLPVNVKNKLIFGNLETAMD